jgi:hypothetical protein
MLDAASGSAVDASPAQDSASAVEDIDAAPGDASVGTQPDAATASPEAGAVAVAPSDHAVGTQRLELEIAAGRTLPVQLWYPAVESAREIARQGRPLQELEPPGPRRDALAKLLDGDSMSCASHSFHAADGAQPWPRPSPIRCWCSRIAWTACATPCSALPEDLAEARQRSGGAHAAC